MNESSETLSKTWNNPSGIWEWLKIVNHKNMGRRYIFTALIFFIAAGVLGLLMRMQLAGPENKFIGPNLYNQIFTVHGTTMMFLFAIPIVEGFGVYVVPLMIGTRDMCFPRLSAYSYYIFLIGGVLLWLSLFLNMAPDAGWFDYVPLAGKRFSPSHRVDVYATVITFIEVSALAAAVELIVTIFKQRAPGMTWSKTPPFVWSILVMAFMIVFAMPGVVVGSVMLATDRILDTSFFDVSRGGDALLWQHLFWWFGHPEVYIAFLPATGIISTVVPVFCRRPLFAYTAVILSLVATGVISFGLWVHHMFTTGIPDHANSFFTVASALIAIPSGVQIFAWIATIWSGKPEFKTPFLFSLGFIIIFVLGGLTGVMVAAIPFDKQVHDTYFVVAHFHYVLIGGVVFPIFAGLYYWWPKLTGKLLNERLGKWNFWLTFIGFNVAFFPMHGLGFMAMPRRVYTYLEIMGWGRLNFISTIGAFVLGIGFLFFLINIFLTNRSKKNSGPNPWNADTLEWTTPSPPPSYNFDFIPAIDGQPAVQGMMAGQREVLVTTVTEAKIQAVVILPGNTIWPTLLSLVTAIGFVGSIFSPWWFVVSFFLVFIVMVAWFWPKRPWDSGRDH